jgi:photosystem II stability/assembly factor-like uncharacterized protein
MKRIIFLAAVGLVVMFFAGCSSDNSSSTGPTSPESVAWSQVWENPRPQGNDLEDVAFVDGSNGWAVGNFHTILHTSDGGSSWLPQNSPSGFTGHLYAVTFADMNNGWAVGDNGSILHTSNGSDVLATWTQQISGATGQFYDVVCTDVNTAWTLGHDGVFHTSDGGTSWVRQESAGEGYDTGGMCFINSTCGWVTARLYFGNYCSVILQTTDGGATWIEHPNGPCDYLCSVSFVDSTHGWTVGQSGRTFPTTDGGVTWTEQRFTPSYSSNSSQVVFRDLNNGWVTVSDYADYGEYPRSVSYRDAAWRTEDGGVTWTAMTSGGRSIAVPDLNQVWIVGTAGSISHSADGGITITGQTQCVTNSVIRDMKFVTETEAWAVGDDGLILHTTDGGLDWSSQDLMTDADLNAIALIDENTMIAVGSTTGYQAEILRIFGGGGGWNTASFGGVGELYDVAFADRMNGFAVGSGGAMLRTKDGGSTWIVYDAGTTNTIQAIIFTNAVSGWAITGNSVLHTVDGGETWQRTTLPGIRYATDISFSTPQNGVIVGDYGMVLHTTDAGATWAVEQGRTINALYSVTLSSSGTGWITGAQGTLMYTSDGGATWSSEYSGTDNDLYKFAIEKTGSNTSSGSVVGENGTIIDMYDGHNVAF